jgi:FlaG/FlaF family flagellin (archaellin)
MKMLNDRRGVSPVITTVIIVAVGITIAIAVALWMTGLVGAFMGYEKIEVRSAFASPATGGGGGWVIVINYINTGSSPAKIDNVFINNIPYNQWSNVECDPNIAGGTYAPANIGVEGTITLTLGNPCKYGDQSLVSGVTVTIKLHSTGGKEYFTSVVLP